MIHIPIQCSKNHYKSHKKIYSSTFSSSISYQGCALSTGAHYVNRLELCEKGVCILFQITIPEHGVIYHSAVHSAAP